MKRYVLIIGVLVLFYLFSDKSPPDLSDVRFTHLGDTYETYHGDLGLRYRLGEPVDEERVVYFDSYALSDKTKDQGVYISFHYMSEIAWQQFQEAEEAGGCSADFLNQEVKMFQLVIPDSSLREKIGQMKLRRGDRVLIRGTELLPETYIWPGRETIFPKGLRAWYLLVDELREI